LPENLLVSFQQIQNPATPQMIKKIGREKITMFTPVLEPAIGSGKRRGPRVATTKKPTYPRNSAPTKQIKILVRVFIEASISDSSYVTLAGKSASAVFDFE
jgi:hypothetical protein